MRVRTDNNFKNKHCNIRKAYWQGVSQKKQHFVEEQYTD